MNYENQLDLELLNRSITGYVPFSVRYGFRKISDWVRPSRNPMIPNPAGRLWGESSYDYWDYVLGSHHDFEAQGTGGPPFRAGLSIQAELE